MTMMTQETGNSGDLDGDDGGDDDDDEDSDGGRGGLIPGTMTFSNNLWKPPNNDVDLGQSGDASENHAPPTEPMLTQDDNINERPTRQRQLTERARLVAQDNDPDNLIGFYYRKRQRSPAPDQNLQKRSRCEAIALVSTFLGSLR